MSIYTNSMAGAQEGGRQYVDAVLDLVADRDPDSILAETVAWCTGQREGLSRTQLHTAEETGKWSVAQVLQHLADSEIVWSYRMRMVLAEDRPPLTGYDQDRWSERFLNTEVSPDKTLVLFGILREANLHLLETASEADRQRVGLHTERAEESVAHMIKLYAGHDLIHRNQITRILKRIRS